MKKKLLSILLSLAMVITMMPTMTMTAFADGEKTYTLVLVEDSAVGEWDPVISFTFTDESAEFTYKGEVVSVPVAGKDFYMSDDSLWWITLEYDWRSGNLSNVSFNWDDHSAIYYPCEHTFLKWVIGRDKHTQICEKCGSVAVDWSAHDFTSGDCVCGAKESEPKPAITINEVKSVDPWDKLTGNISVDYSLGGIDPNTEYAVKFDISADDKEMSVKNDAAKLTEGQPTVKTICTVTGFGQEVTDKNAKIKISLLFGEETLATAETMFDLGPTSVEVPTAADGLVYTGQEQTGVADGTGYTVTNGKATNAGDYTATATLADGYEWVGGTTEAKEIQWSIGKATITVEGITASDKIFDETTSATLNFDNVQFNGLVVGEELTLDTDAITGAFDTPDVGQNKTVTIYGLALADAEDKDYLKNYKLDAENSQKETTASIAAALTSVEVPTAADGLVYTGQEQTGVADGTGYTVTNGKATNAGDYTATATLADGYEWVGGTTEAKQIQWSIAPATLKIYATPYEDFYDGEAHLPTWTVTNAADSVITDATVYIREKGETDWIPVEGFAPYTDYCNITLEIKAEKTNYETVTKETKILIKPRPVTLVAGSDEKVYDGSPLTCTGFTIQENTTPGYGFITGEGVDSVVMTAESTITDPGSVANVIANYYLKEGTNTNNYLISTEPGTLTVTPGVHEHSFTYSADGAVLTATCTEGCDKGYDTTPLTLTLTAPSSLVYDGSGKAATFADGEAAAWTGTGLELPTITYTAKTGSKLTDGEAVEAGSYTASVIVNEKSASIDFTITKADMEVGTNITAPSVPYSPLVFNGQPQQLLNSGLTYDEKDGSEFGTFYYSADGTNWSTGLPTAISAGEYNPLWYFVGDGNHNNIGSQENPISQLYPVVITKEDQSAPATDEGYTVDRKNGKIIPKEGYEIRAAVGMFAAKELPLRCDVPYYVRKVETDALNPSDETEFTVAKGEQTAPKKGEGYTVDRKNGKIIPKEGYEIRAEVGMFAAKELPLREGKPYYVRKAETGTLYPSPETEFSVAEGYTVTIIPAQHGEIVVTADGYTITSGAKVAKDIEVTVKANPNRRYYLKKLTVTDADNETVTVSKNTFTMPDKDVTITAEFGLIVIPIIDPTPGQTDKEQFESYKTLQKIECDKLITITDSEEVKALVADAKTTIDNTQYDSKKSLAENKAVVDSIVAQLKSDIDQVRADEATTALVKASKVALTKATAYKNGKIKLTFKSLKLKSGVKVVNYQVYRSTSKKFNKNLKKANIKRTADTKNYTWTNAKKLKKGTKYYYKVRGKVQLSDGTYVYTKWSNVKNAKCKKTR